MCKDLSLNPHEYGLSHYELVMERNLTEKVKYSLRASWNMEKSWLAHCIEKAEYKFYLSLQPCENIVMETLAVVFYPS